MRCSTGAGPGAAPRDSEGWAELPAPATAVQRLTSLAPSSAWHSNRGPCLQPGGTGGQSICPESEPPSLWAARHTLLHSRRAGQQCSEVAGPAPDHCSTVRGVGKGCGQGVPAGLCHTRPATQGSFLLCGWHRGCIWNRYGTAAIGLHTQINVFVNSAQVTGESLAGQSYRRLVTLHFTLRASAKFGFFSIVPLNLKNKQ